MTSLRTFAVVLFAAILLLSGCNSKNIKPIFSASMEVPCIPPQKVPGGTLTGLKLTSLVFIAGQQLCLGEHIHGFGGYYGGCTMVVYLTDLEQEEAARAILEPYSEVKMRGRCRGRRVSLDIRQGQYEYAELYRWANMSFDLLMKNTADTKVSGVSGINFSHFFDNRVDISVDKDNTISRVKQVLREHNLPVEAFTITSKESRLKAKAKALALFSIAPVIRRSASGEHVVIPEVRWGGRKPVELIMGETSLHEILQMLPPFPGHGPKKSSGKVGTKFPAEIQQVLDRIERNYNPAYTWTIVGFDRKKKLIFIQNTIEREQAERLADELDSMTDMSEVYRDPKTIVKQGKLTPCVIVRTHTILEDNNTARVNEAAYFFTCKTKR